MKLNKILRLLRQEKHIRRSVFIPERDDPVSIYERDYYVHNYQLISILLARCYGQCRTRGTRNL